MTTRKSTLSRHLLKASLALAALSSSVHAASFTWSGLGSDSAWSTGANWVGGVAPASATDTALVFTGLLNTTPNADAAWTLGSITFNSAATNFTLTGSDLSLAAGAAVTVNSSTPQTITNSGIVLSGESTWNTAFANLSVSSAISGPGSIVKTGAGTLTLSGSSSYQGTTTVKSGTFALTPGGSIDYTGADLTVGDVSGDSGSIFVNGGHLRNGSAFVGKSAGSTGSVKINDGAWETFNQLNIGGSSLDGEAGAGLGTVEINGGYVYNFGGVLLGCGTSGTGSMIVTGGTLALNSGMIVGRDGGTGSFLMSDGTASMGSTSVGNDGTGTFSVTGGSLTVGFLDIGRVDGKLLIDGGSLNGTSGVALGTSGGVGSATVTSGTWTQASYLQMGIQGSGTLTVNGGYASFNTAVLVGALGDGTANISSGTLAVNGDTYIGGYLIYSGTGAVSVSGGLLSTTGTMTLGDGGGTASLSISGSAGNRGVVSASRLVKSSGTATVNVNGGILQARQNEADFLSGFAAGDVTIGQGGATIDTQAFTVGIAAALSGTGRVTKIGSGTLAFSGTSDHAGGTVVSEGTLLINGDHSAAGGVEVESGATLGGTGRVSDLLVRNGGKLAPGESPGLLTVDGDLTLEGGSTLAMEFTGTGAGAFDQIAIADVFTAGGTLFLDVSYAAAAGDTFTIFTDGLAGRGWNAGGFTIDTNLDEDLGWDTSTLATNGTISVVAVPEPTTGALISVALAGLALTRRGRKGRRNH